MLSAAEIILQSKKDSSLPDSGGQKCFGFNNTEEHQQSVKHALDELSKFLHEERICRKSLLTTAYWDDKNNQARVEIKKGSSFAKFGYQTRDGMFFNPEETLFLVDQGLLELSYDNLPLSLQEVYMLIVPLLPSLEYYQVYAYLCRLGFLVKRYYAFIGPLEERSDLSVDDEIMKSEQDMLEVGENFEPMSSRFLKCLWEGEAKNLPLIKPSEAKNTAAVLSKLQVVKPIKLKEAFKSCDYNHGSFEIHFNVYVSKQQKKSELSNPNFRIVVCRFCDPPPSLFDISKLSQQADGVHLKLAVVNQGTVSFYGMFGVDLPTIISCG